MPNPTDLHVDRPLTNFAVEYRNEEFIAAAAVPSVPVEKKSDSYYIYDKKDRFTLPETIRGPKDEAKMVDWNVSTASYKCIDHALKDFLPDAAVANADQPLQPRQKTVETLTDLILLRKEFSAKTLLFTAGNYGSPYKTTLTGDDLLSKYATADPIGVIDTAKAACFVNPNTIVMGKEVFDKLKRHPQLIDLVKGGATTANIAQINLAQMAEIFGVQRILVGAAKYNSANKGQTASFSYIWGKFIYVGFIDPSPQMMGVSHVKMFTWKQIATEQGWKVRSWRDEKRGGGGEEIEVETSFDEKIVCSDAGYLISAAIE